MPMSYTILDGDIKLIDNHELPRATQDPIWLTEHVIKHHNVQTGDTLCDVGSGIGTIALILAHKFPNVRCTGYEYEPNLVKAANTNAALNNLNNCLFNQQNVYELTNEIQSNHIVSNPPYHNTEKGFDSVNKNKKMAHGANTQEIKTWIKKCLQLTKIGGTCSIIHHSQNLPYIESLLKEYNYEFIYIKTSPKRPPKRVIITIKK